jgi:pimeloyl-ACP methyl ester carboxylesterase
VAGRRFPARAVLGLAVLCLAGPAGVISEAADALAAPAPAVEPLQPISGEALDAVRRFYDYDATIPLEGRVVELKENETFVRERIVFRGVEGFLVPGYLERPRSGAAGPVPVVLLLHGWSGSKENWWQDGGYIRGGNVRTVLLHYGFAVLALDAAAHGDRRAENGYAMVNDLRVDGEPSHRNYFTLEEIVVRTVRDYRRALDYLATREEIDVTRVGMIGYSMGGLQTFILTAVEPRIRAAVACATPAYPGRVTSIAPKDYAQGIGERPFLMLMGRSDSMCHESHARQLLEMIPSQNKELIFFDSGHKLPIDYIEHALVWIRRHAAEIGD